MRKFSFFSKIIAACTMLFMSNILTLPIKDFKTDQDLELYLSSINSKKVELFLHESFSEIDRLTKDIIRKYDLLLDNDCTEDFHKKTTKGIKKNYFLMQDYLKWVTQSFRLKSIKKLVNQKDLKHLKEAEKQYQDLQRKLEAKREGINWQMFGEGLVSTIKICQLVQKGVTESKTSKALRLTLVSITTAVLITFFVGHSYWIWRDKTFAEKWTYKKIANFIIEGIKFIYAGKKGENLINTVTKDDKADSRPRPSFLKHRNYEEEEKVKIKFDEEDDALDGYTSDDENFIETIPVKKDFVDLVMRGKAEKASDFLDKITQKIELLNTMKKEDAELIERINEEIKYCFNQVNSKAMFLTTIQKTEKLKEVIDVEKIEKSVEKLTQEVMSLVEKQTKILGYMNMNAVEAFGLKTKNYCVENFTKENILKIWPSFKKYAENRLAIIKKSSHKDKAVWSLTYVVIPLITLLVTNFLIIPLLAPIFTPLIGKLLIFTSGILGTFPKFLYETGVNMGGKI